MGLLTYIFVLCLGTFSAGREPVKYKLRYLNNDGISTVLKTMKPNRFEEILDPMLVARVSGTKANAAVREYIAQFMRDLGWEVKFDSFEDRTPFGTRKFSNIIATLNPSAKRRLIIACHYDSKLSRENTFIMATDSAVPCAMMMSLAEDLKQPLSAKKKSSSDVTLQLIFFDGEEAFISWTESDSLYGSRHLAAKWAKTNRREGVSELSKIDAFILLDLIGSSNPTFYNFFEETAELYNRLVAIEKKLHDLGKLNNHTMPNKYFKPAAMRAGIEDDHLPFYRRGVAVLHLIPVPFPAVWHTERDTKQNLDFMCIANLNKIFWSLVVEYLHLMQDGNS